MAARRRLDFYETPAWMTRVLLASVGVRGIVLEPACGRHAIAGELRRRGLAVVTNDVNWRRGPDYRFDAAAPALWALGPWDWTITNPPFSHAAAMLPRAFAASRRGVAFLLRLSFAEPCADRRAFLLRHPPSDVIVMERESFTEDGKTDSVTAAWFVWRKGIRSQRFIVRDRQWLEDARRRGVGVSRKRRIA